MNHNHHHQATLNATAAYGESPYAPVSDASFQYKPATTIWNLNKVLRRCGIPVPTRYCSKMHCVKDAAGYVAASFTWFFIAVGEVMIVLNCLSTNKVTAVTCVNIGITFASSLLAFISHLKCMFSDPGIVQRGNATEENIARLNLNDGRKVMLCVKCNSIKPDRTHHCSVCQRCIRKMDHHCPWVNNCIGEYNQKFFVLFTGYVCFMSCYGFGISISTLVSCMTSLPESYFNQKSGWNQELNSCYFSVTTTLFISVCLAMESLMFGIFTAIMCGTQMNSICTDETKIESLKGEARVKTTCCQSLRNVFGGRFSFRWFSPFHNYIPLEDPPHLESV